MSTWLERLEMEHDNLRGALSWTSAPERQDDHVRLAASLTRFWLIRAHFAEGRRWSDAALDMIRSTSATPTGIKLLNGAGNLAFAQGDFRAAKQRYEAALEGAIATEDKRMQSALNNNLGNIAMRFQDLATVTRYYERALQLSIELDDDFMRSSVLGNLGSVAHLQNDIDGAIERYSESLAIWRRLGNAQNEVTMLLNLQLLLAPHTEHAERARMFGDRCLALSRRLGDRWNEAVSLMGMGQIEDARENLDGALAWYTQSLETLRSLDSREWIQSLLGYVGVVLLDQGEIEHGTSLVLEKLDDEFAVGVPEESIEITMQELAVALLRRNEPRLAAVSMGAAQSMREKLGVPVQPQCLRRHERCMAELMDRLGPSLEAALEEGRERPIGEVVDGIRRALCPAPEPPMAGTTAGLLADLDALLSDPMPPTA
jgi:tetratricopeptide (TPR) repeat protein